MFSKKRGVSNRAIVAALCDSAASKESGEIEGHQEEALGEEELRNRILLFMRFLLKYSLVVLIGSFSAMSVFADELPRLVDSANVLTSDFAQEIELALNRTGANAKVDLAVLLISGHRAATLRDYAYVQLALRGPRSDDIPRALIVVDLKTEETHFAVSEEAEPFLSPGAAEWISEHELKALVHSATLKSDLLSLITIIEQLLSKTKSGSPLATPRQCSSFSVYFLQALAVACIVGILFAPLIRTFLTPTFTALSLCSPTYLFLSKELPPMFAALGTGLVLVFSFCELSGLRQVFIPLQPRKPPGSNPPV